MSSVGRHSIQADGRWHAVTLNGRVLKVGMFIPKVVDIFAMHHTETKADDKSAGTFVPYRYQFRVFATDEALPADTGEYIGSAWLPGSSQAWHVFRRI